VETTWFPFFEQLYRQTISGGRDVLCALADAGTAKVRILPFDAFTDTGRRAGVVVEGFPGWTLTRSGLCTTGYKQKTKSARRHRLAIVNGLRRSGIPISDAVASRAVDDAEGDAVDALVLLLAAQGASRRTEAEWRWSAETHGRMEGWFFD
jgi:hypothetical protein